MIQREYMAGRRGNNGSRVMEEKRIEALSLQDERAFLY
jgi:hypothetical protein